MSPLSQNLPLAYRDALVLADMAQGGSMDAALLLPAATQAAGVMDGTSNTIMFGELAARPVSRSEMARLWNSPSLLKQGFGLLLPAAAWPPLPAGLWLPAVQLLPYVERNPSTTATAAGTRALKISGTVAHAGGSGAALGLAGLWFAPLSIIGILIGL